MRTHEHMLALPFAWSRPRMVFVNSMRDLFHQDVPLEFIQQVFDVVLELLTRGRSGEFDNCRVRDQIGS